VIAEPWNLNSIRVDVGGGLHAHAA
jgi:hypothetical protein